MVTKSESKWFFKWKEAVRFRLYLSNEKIERKTINAQNKSKSNQSAKGEVFMSLHLGKEKGDL